MTALVASQPACFSKKMLRLLDQQFWRWGCDVKNTSGNLLVRFGFQRIPPPNLDSSKSSVYVLEINSWTRVLLRGSASFYGNDRLGGLLIKRFDAQPYRTPLPKLAEFPHTPDSLPPLERFDNSDQQWSKLASKLFSWIAHYEVWIVREYGIDYVKRSLELRGKRPVVEASASASEWLRIADGMS